MLTHPEAVAWPELHPQLERGGRCEVMEICLKASLIKTDKDDDQIHEVMFTFISRSYH